MNSPIEQSLLSLHDRLYLTKIGLLTHGVAAAVRLIAALIRPFGSLCILVLWGDRFGPLCSEPAKYLRLHQTTRGKRLRLVGVVGPLCNEPLLTILRRGMPILRSRRVHQLLQLTAQRGLVRDVLKLQDLDNYYSVMNEVPDSPVLLTEDEEQRGAEMLEALGVPRGCWFVCFHSRDASYLSRTNPRMDWRYHDYRDCSIENYLPAMRRISELGGFAIRMGQIVARPLPHTGDPRIIDFATQGYDSFLDIYLLAHCRFMVCSTAGLHSGAEFFNRPIAMANTIPLSVVPLRPHSRFIPKLLRHRRSGRILTFDEMVQIGVMDRDSNAGLSSFYDERQLDVLENTPEDILALTNEMLAIEKQNVSSLAQRRFNEYLNWLKPDEVCAGIADSFLSRHPEMWGRPLLTTPAHHG